MTPKIVDWTNKFGFGGPRDPNKLLWICIHVTVNSIGTPAENVANYQINSESGSYHTLVDTVKLLRENTADWVTWSTGNEGNYLGLHLSFVARGDETREQWLAQEDMLRRGAWECAQWARAYGIPVVKLTPQQVAGKKAKGFIGHVDTRILGGTDHVDPGAGFPWDVFLRYVQEEMKAVAQPVVQEKENQLTTKFFTDFLTGYLGPQIDAIQEIWRQLRGPGGKGWAQLGQNERGQNLTLVDAVAAVRHQLVQIQTDIDQLKEKK